jgi:phenylpropionate dioxygenase-like ring-hydroxylating dioxygenase large terminal subunit
MGDDNQRAWAAPAYAVREQDGLVWVYASANVEPETEPFVVALDSSEGYVRVIREVEAEATLHAAIENALDVPHTAYLHRGLFRGGEKNEITAVVTRQADRVVTEYKGEPRPPGIVARILSPSGGIVEHWDRFFLPSIAQVEYRLGRENHFLVTSMCTPVSDTKTLMFAVVHFKTRFPGRLVRPILEPFAQHVFKQDARILKKQTETIHRFGGEQFINTDLDLMGPHIWRLLKQSERGPIGEDTAPVVREVRFFA